MLFLSVLDKMAMGYQFWGNCCAGANLDIWHLLSIKLCYIVVKLLHLFSPKKLWYFHVAYQQREMSLQRGGPRDQITK